MRTLALGLTVMLAVAGCAIGTEQEAHRLDLQVDAGVLTTPSSNITTLDSDAIALSVYLIRDNRLVHVTRELANPDSSSLDSVVSYAMAGPTPAEARSGIWSAIPPETLLIGTRLEDGAAEINLSSDFAAIGGTDEFLAVAQIVWSVTALTGVDTVVFLLEGTPTSVPGAGGVLVSGPLDQDEYTEVIGQ